MALQGTVETFPLPDVMRLLAGSNKSGRLTVSGDSLEGVLWFDDGHVFRGDLGDVEDVEMAEVLVALLRLPRGSFRFDPGQAAADGVTTISVDEVLETVDEALAEYERLERTVPDMDAPIRLRGELSDDEVSIDTATWEVVVALREPMSGSDLGATLGLRELDTMRVLEKVAGKGLIQIGSGATDAPRSVSPVNATEAADREPSGSSFRDLAAVVDRLEPLDDAVDEVLESPVDEDGIDAEDDPFYDHEPAQVASEVDEAEIAQQLASLSPAAAQAVARAARATTTEEREEALTEVEADGTIDRDVLLRFLGTIE